MSVWLSRVCMQCRPFSRRDCTVFWPQNSRVNDVQQQSRAGLPTSENSNIAFAVARSRRQKPPIVAFDSIFDGGRLKLKARADEGLEESRALISGTNRSKGESGLEDHQHVLNAIFHATQTLVLWLLRERSGSPREAPLGALAELTPGVVLLPRYQVALATTRALIPDRRRGFGNSCRIRGRGEGISRVCSGLQVRFHRQQPPIWRGWAAYDLANAWRLYECHTRH